MKPHEKRRLEVILEAVIVLLFIVAACMLVGCGPTWELKKVTKATNYLDSKGKLPIICSTRYPCVTTKLDTTYITSSFEDSFAIRQLQAELEETKKLLAYVYNLPPVIDSVECQELKRVYLLHLKADEKRNQDALAKQERLIDSIMVLTAKVKDSAELKVLLNERKALAEELAKAQVEITKATKERDEKAALAKKRGSRLIWIYVILGLIVGGGIYRFAALPRRGF